MHQSFLLNSVIIFPIMFIFNFIGATTGGSALVTIPTCIFLGFPPYQAVATVRVGVLGSTLAGWYGFKKQIKVDYKTGLYGAICASVGVLLGAYYIASLPPKIFQRGQGVVIIFILVTMLWKKTRKNLNLSQRKEPTQLRKLVGYLCLSVVGFLSGMFGGQGTILNTILVSAFGKSILEASGTRMIINLIMAILALIIYNTTGIIDWHYAAIILVAMILGTYFGTLYGLKKGEQWVEKLFTVVAFLMALKLIF